MNVDTIHDFISILDQKGYDISGIMFLDTDIEYYIVFDYSDSKWVIKADVSFKRHSMFKFKGLKCICQGEIPDIKEYKVSDSEIPIRYINGGKILASPISIMIGYPCHAWKFSIARTLEELHYVILYEANKRIDSPNGISLFYHFDDLVFKSIQGIIYDRYNTSDIDKDVFPRVIANDKGEVYPSIDFFWKILDNKVEQYKEYLPKYSILYIQEECKVLMEDKWCLDKSIVIDTLQGEDDIPLIEQGYTRYKDRYMWNDDYTYTVEPIDAIQAYLKEFDPFIFISKDTAAKYGGRIIPICKDLCCIDITKIPSSWREDGIICDMMAEVTGTPYIDVSDRQILNPHDIDIIYPNGERRIFTVHIDMTNMEAHSVPGNTISYKIYDTFIPISIEKIPDRVTIFEQFSLPGYTDIGIILQK